MPTTPQSHGRFLARGRNLCESEGHLDVPVSSGRLGISKTLEFLLSPSRDAQAAKRLFSKTLTASQTTSPRVMTVDKNAAYPKALNELKAEGTIPESCELRQVKYLNNLVEQDHRFIKRLVKPGLGFFSFDTAWRT